MRSVIFYNGLTHNLSEQPGFPNPADLVLKGDILPPAQREGISVQALYKIAGQDEWYAEDWTTDSNVGFCRDAKDQRVEELVLIFANAQYDKDKPSYTFTAPGLGSELVYSDVGCWQWKGTITATRPDDVSYDNYEIRVTDIVLERATDWVSETTIFDVKSGQGTISFSWNDEEIQQWGYTDGAQAFSLAPGNTFGYLITHNLTVAGPSMRAYEGSLSASAEYAHHWFVDDDPDIGVPYDHPQTSEIGLYFTIPNWFESELRLFAAGATMQGTYTASDTRYDYHLTAQREP